MTLTEIIVASLERLGRGTDNQTIKRYRPSFTNYANKAVFLIAKRYKPCKMESVPVTNETFNISSLTREPIRLLRVLDNGSEVSYEQTYNGSGIFTVSGVTSATVDVVYRFVPKTLSNSQDVPELPEYTHDAIVNYVVASARAGGDPDTQASASFDFQLFNEQLRGIHPSDLGQTSASKITNYFN